MFVLLPHRYYLDSRQEPPTVDANGELAAGGDDEAAAQQQQQQQQDPDELLRQAEEQAGVNEVMPDSATTLQSCQLAVLAVAD